ncbi:hypothetical protein E4U43_004677 [Claviceps pusilla]|uniref:Uncharacterized protein n=1 Tax=Claviceps pusilla TaxID=123648 RepID=A0A9P7T1S7_9HYPO|nr:hypothetical protein E4U43_004677 [Claviceps pusilla]
MSNEPRSSWTHSVQDVCQQIGTNLAEKNELWSSITAQRTLKFRLVPHGQNHYLRAEEVKNYLRLAAIIQLPGVINREKCRRICSMAFHALSHVERDGFIDIADYQVFTAHLKHRHDSDLGVNLALALPPSGISTRNVTVNVNMALKLPYQPHYGLVNLCRLYQFMPSINTSSVVKYEVRGPKGLNGIFVTSEAFRALIGIDGLQCDTSRMFIQRECELDAYQHPEWYLITANESGKLYHGRGSLVFLNGTETTIGKFLQEHAETRDYLDIAAPHALEGVEMGRIDLVVNHLCTCSTLASTDDYSRFQSRRQDEQSVPRSLEADAWQPLETDASQSDGGRTLVWIDSQSQRTRTSTRSRVRRSFYSTD